MPTNKSSAASPIGQRIQRMLQDRSHSPVSLTEIQTTLRRQARFEDISPRGPRWPPTSRLRLPLLDHRDTVLSLDDLLDGNCNVPLGQPFLVLPVLSATLVASFVRQRLEAREVFSGN